MPRITTFAEAQNALRPLYNNSRTAYTLDAMQELMLFLGNPQDKLRVLHVAGTSGKTSTAYYCAALLHEAGKSVGLTVSPHVDYLNERLQINGQPLPEAEFCTTLDAFLTLIADCPVKPSYFECLVALAYWEFARRGVDYAVIEVGLGGLLDGTNIVNRTDKVCLITDIGLDHTEILGDTLPAIAAQKAGIIQPGNMVFMQSQDESVVAVVRQTAKQAGAQVVVLPRATAVSLQFLPPFQQRNLGLAAAAVEYVLQRDYTQPLADQTIETAAHVTVPARLEQITIGNKTVILDGSHNQQKMQALLQGVAQLHPNADIAVLTSFVSGSDERWQGALGELIKVANRIVFTSFHSEKDYPKSSVNTEEFVKFCESNGFSHTTVQSDPAAAYAELLQRPEPVLLVTGSFYLMNHIRPLVEAS